MSSEQEWLSPQDLPSSWASVYGRGYGTGSGYGTGTGGYRRHVGTRKRRATKRRSRKQRSRKSSSKKKSSKKRRSRKKRSSKKKSVGKCKQLLRDKIRVNMDEYKAGRWPSRSQAIAVSYSQVMKAHPACRRWLRK